MYHVVAEALRPFAFYRHLLEFVTHEGIPILTPAQFLQRMRESEA